MVTIIHIAFFHLSTTDPEPEGQLGRSPPKPSNYTRSKGEVQKNSEDTSEIEEGSRMMGGEKIPGTTGRAPARMGAMLYSKMPLPQGPYHRWRHTPTYQYARERGGTKTWFLSKKKNLLYTQAFSTVVWYVKSEYGFVFLTANADRRAVSFTLAE